jgi:hypothetical protein
MAGNPESWGVEISEKRMSTQGKKRAEADMLPNYHENSQALKSSGPQYFWNAHFLQHAQGFHAGFSANAQNARCLFPTSAPPDNSFRSRVRIV